MNSTVNTAPPTAAAIETRGLTRVHKTTRALDDVTVQIRANAITGLLGRNGAGKTTFMSLATAQDRPTSGEVRVLGEQPFENARVLEQLCFIRDNQRYPDDYALVHAIRAARIFYPNWDQPLADELIELFNIPNNTVVKKFSRGQFSALGIVLGLASRAPITFFDEPYLGLDATARGYFYDVLLRDYQAHPRTIVLSTHLIDEMDRLLERVIILDHGRVVRDADVDELRGAAHQVAGRASAMDDYLAGRRVLSRQRVGGLATAVVEGAASHEDRAAAFAADLDLSSVSLQQLVAAYGFEGEPRRAGLDGTDPESRSADLEEITAEGARS
ncbi:MAG: ATP-binding cassette domain-containing protein [Leucobacter sp.]